MPEIKRCNLSNIILQLKALGIDDIIRFDFMEKPSRASIVKSLEQLFLLGALTDDYKLLDSVGNQMASLPLHPIYSKPLVLASDFNCMEEMLITVAMLSVESIFYSPRDKLEEATNARKRFSSIEGDHLTLLNVYRASSEFVEKRKFTGYKGKIAGKSLVKWCRDNFINSRSLQHAQDIHSQIRGRIENMALKQPDDSYRTLASSQTVQVHPYSVLFQSKKPADCLIFNELVRTNVSNKVIYIRNVTTIDPLWLAELAPQYYATQD
ncbi:hypothetical protein Scep_012366 [Stephania cephalantha]|uniref:RNA helicase n=1 Tax=Stephania cephalantha TaxID=152367 RepID=A0AAP0JF13_9MAGN